MYCPMMPQQMSQPMPQMMQQAMPQMMSPSMPQAMPQMCLPMDDHDSIMGFPVKYPKVYYKLYPKVKMLCEQMDLQSNPSMYPCPSHETIEQMTDHLYNTMSKEDLAEIESCLEGSDRQLGFSGRRLLRDLIGILLIRELIRRRRFFNPFGFGGVGFPGVGF